MSDLRERTGSGRFWYGGKGPRITRNRAAVMSARLNAGGQDVADPAAVLTSPGLACVYLSERGSVSPSWLAFTDPAAAREVAAACTRAAELLEGPQVTEA